MLEPVRLYTTNTRLNIPVFQETGDIMFTEPTQLSRAFTVWCGQHPFIFSNLISIISVLPHVQTVQIFLENIPTSIQLLDDNNTFSEGGRYFQFLEHTSSIEIYQHSKLCKSATSPDLKFIQHEIKKQQNGFVLYFSPYVILNRFNMLNNSIVRKTNELDDLIVEYNPEQRTNTHKDIVESSCAGANMFTLEEDMCVEFPQMYTYNAVYPSDLVENNNSSFVQLCRRVLNEASGFINITDVETL